jgi:hypothetical protein
MRRLVVSVMVAFGLAMAGAGTAHAEPVPGTDAAKAEAGKKVCKITDPKLDELSGIVATDDGFVVVNDSAVQTNRKRVFFLDDSCEITDEVSYSGNGPRDTEDLLLSPDGKTLWIADIGDNQRERDTIGVWSMAADGSKKPKLYRLTYPEGAEHDAEALLLNGDGTPIVVTKEVGKAATLYTPTAKLKTGDEGVPLRKAGEVTVPPSSTPGTALARLGRGTINGGAVAPGGGKVVLRTYTDALEWTVTGGDVLAALKGKPRVTPLPNEPLGEAITYSPDGRYFYTVSDMQGDTEAADNHILRYTPVTQTATTKNSVGGAGGGDDEGPSWFADLSLDDITYLVGAVGLLGAILVGLGVFGIVRSRKRAAAEPPAKGDGLMDPADPETELLTVGGAAAGRGAGVYGGGAGGAGGGSGIYGGARPAGAGPQKGGVYGGQPAGRPGAGQPAGRPGAGQPAGRPGAGQPAGRPGAGRPGGGQPAGRPGAGQPVGHPGAGQPAGRPGAAQPPGRPGPVQPGRPGPAQPGARPGAQPPGRTGGQPPGRSGGQPAGRPVPPPPPPGRGGRPAPPSPPPGRPGGGVYGSPPPSGRNNAAGGRGASGFYGQGAGHPGDGGRMQSYVDLNGHGRGRDYDNPGYGRTHQGH